MTLRCKRSAVTVAVACFSWALEPGWAPRSYGKKRCCLWTRGTGVTRLEGHRKFIRYFRAGRNGEKKMETRSHVRGRAIKEVLHGRLCGAGRRPCASFHSTTQRN